MKSVLLITPPSGFLLDERVFVSLGILRVAAVMESQGWHVEHLDLSGVVDFADAVRAHVASSDASAVGLTSTTPQLPGVVRIVQTIRAVRPDVRIILGGPHVTLTHAAALAERRAGRASRAHRALAQLEDLVDVLVSGDGELAIIEALGPSPAKCIDADDVNSPLFLTDQSYESLPYPARHLVDLTTYRYEIEGHPSTSLIAQLGCPFGCGFCGGRNSQSLRVIRTRSIHSIIEEVRLLHREYGYTGFMFYDDELNVSQDLVPLMNALVDLQDELGAEFRLRGFVKAQLFTPEQARSMRGAGFRWILTGFESGSPRILQNINKQSTLDENTRAVEIARAADLKIKALMSVGHPGESPDTIRQTQEWLLRVRPDDFDCSIITTYPGTPYYDEAIPHATVPGVWTYTYKRTGDRLHAREIDFLEVADYYKGDPNGGYKAFVFTDDLTSEELVAQRSWVESSVRSRLRLPYPTARPALSFEHSMGQSGAGRGLPEFILGQSRQRPVGKTSPVPGRMSRR